MKMLQNKEQIKEMFKQTNKKQEQEQIIWKGRKNEWKIQTNVTKNK